MSGSKLRKNFKLLFCTFYELHFNILPIMKFRQALKFLLQLFPFNLLIYMQYIHRYIDRYIVDKCKIFWQLPLTIFN